MKKSAAEYRYGIVRFAAAVVGFLAGLVGAQSPAGQPTDGISSYAGFNPSMAVILVLIAGIFATAFCSIYLRSCYRGQETAGGVSVRPWRGSAARGLGKESIEALPTFSYAEVKGHKIGKGALECAVCLNEFEDDDALLLLPKCDHVFHPECIGAWLEHHVTCPVCRSDLTKPAAEVPSVDVAGKQPGNEAAVDQICSGHDEIAVQVDEPPIGNQCCESSNQAPLPPRSQSVGRPKIADFAKFRSHTTGHSLVLPGENLERFTLRLPEGVRREVVERSMLNRASSYAVGKGRSLGAMLNWSYSRSTRSGRRAAFARTQSVKLAKQAAEGRDGGGGKALSRMASLKCLEPKAADEHEAGLISNDAARLPV